LVYTNVLKIRLDQSVQSVKSEIEP